MQFNIVPKVILTCCFCLTADFGALARVTQTAPRLTVDAALVTGVTRDCQPVGPDDFETFTAALEVGANLGVNTLAHFEIDVGLLASILDFPTTYDHNFFAHNFTLVPLSGNTTQDCIVIVDDSKDDTSASASPSSSTLTGVPASTGTLFPASSAVPTWDFSKIESYSSANGHLPTNVNYQQMVQATSVPPDILQAISSAASSQSVQSVQSTQSAGGTAPAPTTNPGATSYAPPFAVVSPLSLLVGVVTAAWLGLV